MPQALTIRGNTMLAVGSKAEIKKLKVAITIVTNFCDSTVTLGVVDIHIHAIHDV